MKLAKLKLQVLSLVRGLSKILAAIKQSIILSYVLVKS